MKKETKLEIKFGVPRHGWLPTILKVSDFELEFEVSDVPVDPIVQLCDALIQITKGIQKPAIITWHLEPYCYYLHLEVINKQYKVIILESDNLDSPTRIVKELTGDYVTIVIPLYNGLNKFHSKSYKQPYWDELEPKRMEELTSLIKEQIENFTEIIYDR